MKERKSQSREIERAGEVERELGEQVKGRERKRGKNKPSEDKVKERDGLCVGAIFVT